MLNHTAILVRSVANAARILAPYGFELGPREEFASEGTAEIYVGPPENTSKLLLIEAIGPGVYARALEKRGTGLHHIALDVPELHRFVTGLSGSGWLLHPLSLETMRRTQTVWLARPGIPLMVEVQQRDDIVPASPFVSHIELPLAPQYQRTVAALGTGQIQASADGQTWLVIGQRRINLRELVK